VPGSPSPMARSITLQPEPRSVTAPLRAVVAVLLLLALAASSTTVAQAASPALATRQQTPGAASPVAPMPGPSPTDADDQHDRSLLPDVRAGFDGLIKAGRWLTV